MTAAVIRADARNLPLPDASIDLIVTSPPYFALRSYQDGGEHYDGQIGAEATPREYIDALLECTREWTRVLKSSGSLWVNLGDKYNSAASGGRGKSLADVSAEKYRGGGHSSGKSRRATEAVSGYPPKSLMGLPWRYALGCIDDLDLILRAEVIWQKSNGMPESVTDRVRRSHEHWFHFTKEPRYYSAVDEIREPVSGYARRNGAARPTPPGQRRRAMADTCNPLGSLPGSVWTIPTQPLKVPAHLDVDHYAAFPPAIPLRIIAGWSPPGICTACGEGRRPTSERELTINRKGRQRNVLDRPERGVDTQTLGWEGVHRITGYACACPTPDAPTRAALVVDPFGGTGTTALAARALGRHGISFDLSHDYARLARWRTTDPGELARVLGMPKPPPVVPGQGDLFTEEAIA